MKYYQIKQEPILTTVAVPTDNPGRFLNRGLMEAKVKGLIAEALENQEDPEEVVMDLINPDYRPGNKTEVLMAIMESDQMQELLTEMEDKEMQMVTEMKAMESLTETTIYNFLIELTSRA